MKPNVIVLLAAACGAVVAFSGCWAPCMVEPDPAAVNVEQGIVGSVYDSFPVASCRNDVIEFIRLDEEVQYPNLSRRYEEQRGQQVAVAIGGHFGKSLEPGRWEACLNVYFDEPNDDRVTCIPVDVAPNEVVAVSFAGTDAGIVAANHKTGSRTEFAIIEEYDIDEQEPEPIPEPEAEAQR